MKTIKAFIESHPVTTYSALVFAILGVLIVVGPGGILDTREQVETMLPPLASLAVPSVAAILLTGLLYGRAGLRKLRSRMLRWRVGARWYAVALLTAPLSMMAALLALSLLSPEFLPRISISAFVLVLELIFFGAFALGFELGWTGFAVHRMRLRYGVLGTGLIVGVLVGAWDFLVELTWDSGTSPGAFSLDLSDPLLPAFLWAVAVLPVYRVLMVWLYDRTESLLLATLMNVSLLVGLHNLVPGGSLAGVDLMSWYLVSAAALWVVVGAVALANGGHLTRQPPRRRAAAQK